MFFFISVLPEIQLSREGGLQSHKLFKPLQSQDLDFHTYMSWCHGLFMGSMIWRERWLCTWLIWVQLLTITDYKLFCSQDERWLFVLMILVELLTTTDYKLFCVQWVQSRWEVIVRFDDIGWIFYHYCLNFLSINRVVLYQGFTHTHTITRCSIFTRTRWATIVSIVTKRTWIFTPMTSVTWVTCT